LLELRNLVDCADLIVRSALNRHESRGLHYIRDYPEPLPASFPTILFKRMGKKNGKKSSKKSGNKNQ
jgi:L-aspartate oxidase